MIGIHKRLGNLIRSWAFPALAVIVGFQAPAFSQSGVVYQGRRTFLNGTNAAWISFSGDLGPRSAGSPNNVNFSQFESIVQAVHDNGGNVLRLWLHTNGTQTPVFGSNGYVTGPGPYAIQDLKKILGIAQQNDVRLMLCLWSNDMLQKVGSQTGLTQTQVNENYKLLTDTSYTMAYIRNSLIPLVNAVKGNTAIAAWEIFNEPEGMSTTFGGWTPTLVPMSDIQRCVNLMAGAIHRTDPNALVTNGAWAMKSVTDVTPSTASKSSWIKKLNSLSPEQLQAMTDQFNAVHRASFTVQQMMSHMDKVAATANYNYYRNDRLIAAGGDSEGTLDFYSVHWYSWTPNALTYAPLSVPCSTWKLDKPVVVAEFEFSNIAGVSAFKNLTPPQVYSDIYSNGYAGAINWQWISGQTVQSKTVQAMGSMASNHPGQIRVNIVNRALGASVTASSNDTLADSSSSPLNVTDGDPLTRWQASPGSSQWLQIDLGQLDSISGITIDWANNTYARNLTVEMSDDHSTWSMIDSVGTESRATNYVQVLDSLDGVGRYIKLLFAGEGNGSYSISDVEIYGSPGSPTVVRGTGAVPGEYHLYQDYPNPFNPSTVISYRLAAASNVTLNVYDVLGREVATLVNSSQSPGLHSVEFDGSRLASGVYFYKLSARPISGQSGDYVKVMKMVLLK